MHFSDSTFIVSYLYQFSAVLQKMLSGAIITNLHYIWCKFRITIKRINAETTPSKGAIEYKFSSQHQHKVSKENRI